MELKVYLQGDLEFANDALVAVTRMFNSGSTYEQIQTGAGILIFLTLFLSYFKYILDPEKSPYPIKEFVLGVMGFIMFVGPLSPRFTVHLQSVSANALAVRTVSNVPFLIAVPSWVGTNLIGGLRDLVSNNFITPGMGTNAPVDPLGALVRLHSTPMSPIVNSLDKPGTYDFKTTIHNYIHDCYIPDQLLSSGNPNGNMTALDAARIDEVIDKIKVSYPDYYTTIFLSNKTEGEYLACKDAYQQIYKHTKLGKFPQMIKNYYGARGVDGPSIRSAYSLLTGGGMASPNPYEVMAGRFVAFHTYEALQGQDQPWVNKMIFEAMQKRLYEQAGERALFLNYMIPMISVFEMFTFFIGPVMVLLSVMGGIGFAMIGKYMYLILFVNLWGFIKVFVDLFTYKAAERAFSVTTSYAQMDPFSLGAMPAVISEIEGFLGVASALTVSIPMLAMFMLYGGVHSLMGVMSSVNPSGKGSVDSSNVAPKISSTWSEGAFSMGTNTNTYNVGTGATESNIKSSNSGRFADVSIGSGISSSLGQSAAIAENQVHSQTQAYEEIASKSMASLEQNSDVVTGATTKNWSEMNTAEKTVALKNSLMNDKGLKADAASQAAFQIMGQLGLSAKAGIPGSDNQGLGGSASASVSAAETNMDLTRFGISETDGQAILEEVAKNHRYQTSNTEQDSYDVSESNLQNDSFQKSLMEGNKLQQQIAESRQLSNNLNEMYDTTSGLKFSQALNNEALAPLVDSGAYISYINGLSDEQVDTLAGNNISGTTDEKRDYLKDKYKQEGIELAGGEAQAGYGSMMAILEDALAIKPTSIEDVNSQSDMLADWSDSVIENASSNNANASQLNALSRMSQSYRDLEETTEIGGVIRNTDPDLLNLGVNTKDADKAEKAIENHEFDLQKPFINDVPSEKDYSKAMHGAMTKELADTSKRVKEHELFDGEQQEVLDRINSGELEGAMWSFSQLQSEDRFAKFAASRASELGYDERTVYEGVQALNERSPSEIQDLFANANTGRASFEDMKTIGQMSHAMDYLSNTQSGNDSVIVGVGAGELEEFSGSALAFNDSQSRFNNTALGRDVNDVLEMGGKDGFSHRSAIDAVSLMSGDGGTVSAQFPYESSLVDLANTNQSYKNGLEQADRNTLFGDGVNYDKNQKLDNSAMESFRVNAEQVIKSNSDGYNGNTAAAAFTSLVDTNQSVPGNEGLFLSDVAEEKMLNGGDNNLLRSVYQNSDALRETLSGIPDEMLPKDYKDNFNEMLEKAEVAYHEQNLASVKPYEENPKLDKTSNIDVPNEVRETSAPTATFKTDSGRYTLQSQNEDGSYVYQNENNQSYNYKQGGAYMTPIIDDKEIQKSQANKAAQNSSDTTPKQETVKASSTVKDNTDTPTTGATNVDKPTTDKG